MNALDENQYIKYQAVLEHEHFSKWHISIDSMEVLGLLCELTQELDNYDFSPGIRPEDIGSYGLVRPVSAQEQVMERTEPGLEMGCY